jgi:hypothetical protein
MKTHYALTALWGLLPALVVLCVNDRERERNNKEQLVQMRSLVAEAEAAETSHQAREAPVITRGDCLPEPVHATPPRRDGDEVDAKPASDRPVQFTEAQIRDNLDIAFIADHGSPRWVGAMKDDATQKLRMALPPGSALRSFECHETICRIETQHADLDTHTTFVRAAFMNQDTQLWNGGFYSVREEDNASADGPLAFVTYLAQPDQNLPVP